jgi:hypothetical protein
MGTRAGGRYSGRGTRSAEGHGPALNGAANCALIYVPADNALYLFNDAGNATWVRLPRGTEVER